MCISFRPFCFICVLVLELHSLCQMRNGDLLKLLASEIHVMQGVGIPSSPMCIGIGNSIFFPGFHFSLCQLFLHSGDRIIEIVGNLVPDDECASFVKHSFREYLLTQCALEQAILFFSRLSLRPLTVVFALQGRELQVGTATEMKL